MLGRLGIAYAVARRAADDAAVIRLAGSEVPRHTCRYCGSFWKPFANSTLPGHARCMVTLEFQREIVALLRANPRITFDAVARACDVGVQVVRAWWANATREAASRGAA